MSDDPTQLIQALLGLIGNDAVGSVVDRDRTALVGTALGTGDRLEQLGHVAGLGIVDLNQFTAQWRQFCDLLLRLELLTLARGNFIRWRYQQHITYLALVQALGFQDQIQRLIPGHILQAQGNIALHRVTGHQVQIGEVRDQLQHRTDVDVLEIQG